MIRYIRDLRLIPIALIASACLLALKTADLALHGSSLFAHDAPPVAAEVSVIRPMPDATAPPGAKLSWAQQMFNYPNSSGAVPLPSPPSLPQIVPVQVAGRESADITGSVTTTPAGGNGEAAPNAKGASDATGAATAAAGKDGKDGKDGRPTLPAGGTLIPTNGAALPTGAERAILERLQQRREELDARARELDIRESLIQNAEKRMDAKLSQLKEVESHIKVETQQKDDAEAARLRGLVTMYENMKARDAAKIFNGLETSVLLQVVSLINPRQMAEILALMAPDVAQRLTVELAEKAQHATHNGSAAELPKIEGQPTAP